MKSSLNLKSFVGFAIAIFALILFALNYFDFFDLDVPKSYFRAYSLSLTATSALIGLFTWQGWKLPIFQKWLVLYPNLNGTWVGSMKSDWVDPKTKERVGPIDVALTVKQSLFGFSCVARSGEMTSYSISAGFESDSASHVHQLIYTYRSEPVIGVSDRSNIHHGTVILEFTGGNEFTLQGKYFTERKTAGDIAVAFESRKYRHKLTKKEKSHPMDSKR